MAYDEDLAARVRELVGEHGVPEEKKMFGGLGFMLDGHMAVAVSGQGGLLVRVGDAEGLISEHAQPMVMGGRESRGWLHVTPEGLRTESQLRTWVDRGVATARALPPKG
jgi:TfoX/Sxy family transcriptional regulator of competence genes